MSRPSLDYEPLRLIGELLFALVGDELGQLRIHAAAHMRVVRFARDKADISGARRHRSFGNLGSGIASARVLASKPV